MIHTEAVVGDEVVDEVEEDEGHVEGEEEEGSDDGISLSDKNCKCRRYLVAFCPQRHHGFIFL